MPIIASNHDRLGKYVCEDQVGVGINTDSIKDKLSLSCVNLIGNNNTSNNKAIKLTPRIIRGKPSNAEK